MDFTEISVKISVKLCARIYREISLKFQWNLISLKFQWNLISLKFQWNFTEISLTIEVSPVFH